MNRLFKQVVAFTIAAMMLFGMIPASAQAVETHNHASSDLAPFSSTENLIQQVKEQLVAEGKLQLQQEPDQAAVEAVEKESDYSFNQAMTMVAMGIFNGQGTEGVIDTARLNLSKDAMDALLDETLKSFYLDGSVTVESVEENGVVTSVNFTTTESFAQVMEEIGVDAQPTQTVATNDETAQPTAEEEALPFTDVSPSFWGVPFIRYVYENNLMNGTGDNEFSPLEKLSRAMVVTVLWRMAGSPEPQAEATFTDLGEPHAGNSWYFQPIAWAQENGIASGLTATTFGPNENVTRQQMVTFLGRFAEYLGAEIPADGSVSKFTDSKYIEAYAAPYVAWAVEQGIVNGYEDGSFQPRGESLRVEFAKIITVFHRDVLPVISACRHANITPVDEVPATCTTDGMAAYYECPDCGLVLDAQGNFVADKATLVLPATGHQPTGTDAIVWNWERVVTYQFGTDENGNLTFNQGLKDPEGNPVPDFPVDEDGNMQAKLHFNPETGEITVGYPEVITWECASAEYDCYSCGEHFTHDTTVSSYVMTEAVIEEKANAYAQNLAMELIGQYVEEKAMAYYMETGAAPSDEQINGWVAEAQQDPELMGKVEQETNIYAYQLAYDMESTFYVATYGEGENAVSNELNATADQLKRDWAEMTSFNRFYPQYFGLVAPYWQSKNTETSPLGAVIYMCSMEEQPLIPNVYLDMMVSMLTQAFMSYVMNYGPMLDNMVAQLVEYVDHRELDTIDKLLLIHDWMAKYATFDMQGLVDITSGASAGSDPISMTAFGLLLNDQIEKAPDATWDGGVCLAYAATYAMLVQQAFGVDQDDPAIVDFAKIQYLSNVAESSVAAGDSGFGDGDAMFNSAHYMNAVKVDGQWYYVDACYDDVNTEVISQYRVETEGNVSHGSFMVSPASWEDMYEGNFQYMDSLYDGKVWNRIPDGEGGYQKRDAEGNVYTQAKADELQAAAEEQGEPIQMFFVYEATETNTETRYEDTTYEEAWFVGANSAINYDPETKYFYYTSGTIASYASMKDLFMDSEDDSGFGGMGDFMSQEDMLAYKADPAYHDRIVRRPVNATNIPETDDSETSFSMSASTDPYAEVLFHYGYGDIGAAANAKFVADSEEDFDFSFGTDDEEETYYGITEEQKGPYYDSHILDDEHYISNYPDLVHSTVMMGGKLYFNIGTGIYTFNKTISELARMDIDDMTDLELVQVKEYDEVTYTSNGRRFTGMSFETAEEGKTLRYHPIAALSVAKDYKVENAPETLFVSVATNLTNSYKDADGNAYTQEAKNYNPDSFRFAEEEEGAEEENDNVEFMWCANIVDKMPVEDMLADYANGATETVSVAAYCWQDAYTQTRTTKFGLVKGAAQVEEGTALGHDFHMDQAEGCEICARCQENHDDEHHVDHDGNGICDYCDEILDSHTHTAESFGEPTWNKTAEDAEGYASCTRTGTCICGEVVVESTQEITSAVTKEPTCEEVGELTYTATFADGTTAEIKEEIPLAHVDEDGDLVCDKCSAALDGHVHAFTTVQEGSVVWAEDYSTCTRTLTCICGESTTDVAEKIESAVTKEATCSAEGERTYTATFSNGDTDDETEALPTTAHEFEYSVIWNYDNDKETDPMTATVTQTCKNCDHKAVEEDVVATATMDSGWSVIVFEQFHSHNHNMVEGVCSECGYKNVHEHAPGEYYYDWAEDYSTCSRNYFCAECGERVFVDEVNTTSEVTKAATCSEEGERTYTASFTEGEPQTKTEVIPATGEHADNDGDGKCDTCEMEMHVHAYTLVEGTVVWAYNADTQTMSCTATVRCSCNEEKTVEADQGSIQMDENGVWHAAFGGTPVEHTHVDSIRDGVCDECEQDIQP